MTDKEMDIFAERDRKLQEAREARKEIRNRLRYTLTEGVGARQRTPPVEPWLQPGEQTLALRARNQPGIPGRNIDATTTVGRAARKGAARPTKT